MVGRVQVAARVAEAEAALGEALDACPVGELEQLGRQRLARGQEGAERVVQPAGEGAGRGVLDEARPADDPQPRQRGDDLHAELGGVAAVEDDALQPPRAAEVLVAQRRDELLGGGQLDAAVRQLEGDRAVDAVARKVDDSGRVLGEGGDDVVQRGRGLDDEVDRGHGAQQCLELLAEAEGRQRGGEARGRVELREPRVGEEREQLDLQKEVGQVGEDVDVVEVMEVDGGGWRRSAAPPALPRSDPPGRAACPTRPTS